MLEKLGRLFKDAFGSSPQTAHAYQMESAVLEGMLRRLEESPEATRPPLQTAIYEKLLGSIVLLPVPVGADVTAGVPLMALKNSQNEMGVPVFTSEKTLQAWVETADNFDGQYVGIPFPVLCGHAMKARLDCVILNVGHTYGGEIGHAEMAYMAEGILPPPTLTSGALKIEKGTEMRLSATNSFSEMVVDRLRDLFKHHNQLIERAYLFEVAFGPETLKPAIAIQMPEGSELEWEISLWPNIQAVLQEMLEGREYANVFLLNEAVGLEDSLGGLAMHPFYTQNQADGKRRPGTG